MLFLGDLRMRRYLIGCLAAAALAMPVAALASFSNMYVFGDSLSDNGNLYGWTGAPNPVTGGVDPDTGLPTSDTPTPIPLSPPYSPPPGLPGTFQNGPSYSQLLWTGLQAANHLPVAGNLNPRGLLPWGPPALDPNPPAGTNYAVGGARSRYHRFDLTDPDTGQLVPQATWPLPPAPGAATYYPFSLRGQFDQFAMDVSGIVDPNALFVVWSGSNDVGDALLLFDPTAADPFANVNLRMQEALQDVGAVLGGLVTAGAEYLLVPNVPDLGLTPELKMKGSEAVLLATGLSAAYNVALEGIIGSLFSINSDLTVYSFDTFALLQQVAAHPGDFGFTNVTDPCLVNFFVGSVIDPAKPVTVCPNPDEFLFWDINHPSAATQQILANGMLSAIPEPGSWLLVGIGLVAVFSIRRGRRASLLAADVATA
jgi:phospholipase/lecithinase/hemolysin